MLCINTFRGSLRSERNIAPSAAPKAPFDFPTVPISLRQAQAKVSASAIESYALFHVATLLKMRFFTVHGFTLLQPFPRAAMLEIEKFKESPPTHPL